MSNQDISTQIKTPGETARLVNMVFQLFQVNYPSEFLRQVPDPEAANFLKKRYAHIIRPLNEAQIKKGFDKVAHRRMSGDKALDYLDLDKILGVITGKMPDTNAAPAGIYQEKHALLTKDGRDKAPPSVAETEMNKLKAMLG